jgi:S-DNA-T family DNA segregation ATPase FtsK/SpoIIIE
MLPGQTLDDYAAVADRLGQTFGTLDCRIHSVPHRVHEVELWLLVHDPLAQVVQPFEPGSDPLHDGLPVARAEDGTVWRLQLLGTHVLAVGATGAGKGSVIWSILTALTPSIAAGLVSVWVVDPKGGMELAMGRRLFDRFCYGDSSTNQASYETTFAVLLEDAVTVMRQRQDRLRGVSRLHEPSTAEPLIVLVIDELAALTAWTIDREAKRRIGAALGLLLSQGRAAGVVVVGAVQDPRKEVLTVRDLFPTRIALRLSEADQVNLVLGPGARNRGALCDQIPDTLPGIGYVAVDGVAEPVRVRFSHITDQNIAQLSLEPVQLQLVVDVDREAA